MTDAPSLFDPLERPTCRVDGCTEELLPGHAFCWRHEPPPPIVGHDDPPTSVLAAELIEPKRETRKGQVLARLRAAGGGWVPGYEISTAECGGLAGTRRARELRAHGWPIEIRPAGNGSPSWDYRIVEATR